MWNGNVNVEKPQVMRISRQPSTVQVTIGKKTTAECDIFKLFG
jgi:hypothetical protein